MRNTYIDNNDFAETLLAYLKNFSRLPAEEVDASASSGRVTAEAIYAKVCDPTYNASAMDGIAVCSKDTLNATEINPLKVEEKGDTLFYTYGVKTGEKQSFSIQPVSIIILDKTGIIFSF